MADDIMAVDERVTRLEVTVTTGFSALSGRMAVLEHKVDGLNARVDALNGKLDVVSESLEDKMQELVLERLDVWTQKSRAARTAMQKRRADRRLMFATLTDHRIRIEALESIARRGALRSVAPDAAVVCPISATPIFGRTPSPPTMVASSSMQIHQRSGADAHLRTLSDGAAEMIGLSEIDAIASALEDRLSRVKGPASHEERIIKALVSLRASPHLYRDTSRRRECAENDADGAKLSRRSTVDDSSARRWTGRAGPSSNGAAAIRRQFQALETASPPVAARTGTRMMREHAGYLALMVADSAEFQAVGTLNLSGARKGVIRFRALNIECPRQA